MSRKDVTSLRLMTPFFPFSLPGPAAAHSREECFAECRQVGALGRENAEVSERTWWNGLLGNDTNL